ncbi:unnamed protein product [Schistosoma mattheei]|uniref:Uncharacterized protein n=1 Tax=Schistosoma mattheei TaxID=31246 RepID=A0A183Q2I3_9TREM|nr:unnamed protein product [Schistosoma mattheei]
MFYIQYRVLVHRAKWLQNFAMTCLVYTSVIVIIQ